MKRLLTAAIGVPATVLFALYSPRIVFALVIALIGALCLEEFLDLGSARFGVRPERWVLLLPWALQYVIAVRAHLP